MLLHRHVASLAALLVSSAHVTLSHQRMTYPPTRATRPDCNPRDYFAQFPAGEREGALAGKKSQLRHAGPAGWTPYTPFDPLFKWRAGVCGGTLEHDDHLAGGKYYDGARVVANFTQGGTIPIEIKVDAHHNGFCQAFLCIVYPGTDISSKSFRNGNCVRLDRVPHPECESGMSRRCGPIDPNDRSRFYIPPPPQNPWEHGVGGTAAAVYGKDGTFSVQLPDHVVCEHCVLQHYCTAADDCNPPGVQPYYEGPRAPKGWAHLGGPAHARGGWARGKADCGGAGVTDQNLRMKLLPEEYYGCSDISISAPAA